MGVNDGRVMASGGGGVATEKPVPNLKFAVAFGFFRVFFGFFFGFFLWYFFKKERWKKGLTIYKVKELKRGC